MPKRPDYTEDSGMSELQRQTGQHLKWVRKLARHTQEQTCELIGVDQSTWSKYEKGERMPDPYKMVIFAARYRVSLDYIYRGRLTGVHPALAELLRLAHPELRDPPMDIPEDRDTLQASYRAAIQDSSLPEERP